MSSVSILGKISVLEITNAENKFPSEQNKFVDRPNSFKVHGETRTVLGEYRAPLVRRTVFSFELRRPAMSLSSGHFLRANENETGRAGGRACGSESA